MPFQLNDASVATQRLQFDNSGNTEFGPATPNSPLSFQGRALLDGSFLAQSIARPDAMPRVTGSVNVNGGASVDVGCPQSAGFGAINGNAVITAFDSTKTTFTISPFFSSGVQTVGYSIF
ncbi:hypothetical protein BDD14_0689 [Edaphobacter modestus]|uniref:Uncharacterized protein n=1 Tax=Edaphobacter modestus TaxID=388466 RepID=A0A4Q7YPG5_9BACT|nr:hypothetical protein BDD14_0689 [Edaphobacter modestus]